MVLRFLLFLTILVVAHAEPLNAILSRMDEAVKNSPSFSANVQWDSYTRAIDDHDLSSGAIKLRRVNNRVLGRLDIDKPNPYLIHFGQDTAEKYLPKANTLEIYRIGKMSKAVTLAVGLVFGISGAEIRKLFDVTTGEEETVNGVKTTRLELVPKDKKTKDLVAKAELWIPVGQSHSIRQRLTAPNGNYNLWDYADIKINPPLPAAAFDFVAPPGTKQNVMN